MLAFLQDKNQFPPLSISKWSLWCHKSVQFHGTYDDLLELRKKEKKKTDRLNVPDQSIIPPLAIKKNVQKSQIWLPLVTNLLVLRVWEEVVLSGALWNDKYSE